MSTQTVASLEVDALRPGEIAAAGGVLARGMRDNPNHVAEVLGTLKRQADAQPPRSQVQDGGTADPGRRPGVQASLARKRLPSM